MKKYFLFLFNFLLFSVSIIAETVVYVGGIGIDGTEGKCVYWRNGMMFAVPERTYGYGGFAVENGNTYLCSYSKDNNYFYVYKNLSSVPIEIFHHPSRENDIRNFQVLNGSFYILTRVHEYDRYMAYLYRNENERNEANAVLDIYVYDGYLYKLYGAGWSNMNGYSVVGNYYENLNSLAKDFYVERMRVIDGNAYFMGKDSKGACIQTNNERRDHIIGYGNVCKDFAKVAGKSFWIIDNKLIDSNGRTIINDGVLQIIGYENKLYVLGRSQQGAIKQVYYMMIDPQTNAFLMKKYLNSCQEAKDFVVVDEY